MINDIARNNGIGSGATFVTGTTKEAETKNEELEALRKQSKELAAILSGGKDSVEISSEARALSEATKTIQEQEVASVAAVNAVISEDDISEFTAAAPVKKTLGSREGRNAIANDYNDVLEDLRSKYGEEEAMRRFDVFMESEGFERVTEESHGMSASGGINGVLRAFTSGLSVGSMPYIERDGPLSSNLSASSTLMGALVDGEVKYFAETYASYGANANQDVIDALSGLYRKNLESAQSGTSVDLAEFMKNNFGSNPQTSVVSANMDLGAVTANLLEATGIELGEDGKVTFSLKEDGSGLYITSGVDDYDIAQKAIDAALQKNPDMLQAFKNEYHSVALTDTGNLDGAYNDGAHSVEYGDASRSFTYSAREPSVVVMTDYVGVSVTGYNYQKKVSDSFDTDADFHTMSDGGVRFTNNNGLVSIESKDVAINQKMNEDIRLALESGEEIESTMTRKEYDAIQAERSAGFIDPAADLAAKAKLYFSSPDAEQAAKAAEARQTLLDLEADPRMQDREIFYRDERREAQKSTVSHLLELFDSGRKAPNLDMINSIMESLRSMGAAK